MMNLAVAILTCAAAPMIISLVVALWGAVTGRAHLARHVLIAWDQTANVLIWAQGEGWGHADETLSARAWRLRDRPTWGAVRWVLDALFWRDRDRHGQRAHCYLSWVAEREREHLPADYHQAAQE